MFNRKKIKELEEKIKELEGSLDALNKKVIISQNPRRLELLDNVSFENEYHYPIDSKGCSETHSRFVEGVVIDYRFDYEDCVWNYRIAGKELHNNYWVEQGKLKNLVTF